LFPWSQLENLYYRERKFSIEVHEKLKIDNESSPKGDFVNPVKVYAWFASIPSLCKSIWLMSVAQHQFFLDKKQNKVI
jgi:FERM domain-containing protein 4